MAMNAFELDQHARVGAWTPPFSLPMQFLVYHFSADTSAS